MIVALVLIGPDLGLSANITSDFIALFPYLFGVILGFGITVYTRGLYALPSFFFVGVMLSLMTGEMWDMGMINAAMFSGLSLEDFQMWLIVLSVLFGGVVTGLSWRG